MPQRTTPLQMVVHFVRKHMAGPGVTVTESKMLHDSVLDEYREVDVVIEGDFDGDPIVTSIEVTEQTDPVDLPLVQQKIAAHRHLPTNRLVLVSKAGFTKKALKAVAAEGGWVDAAQPMVIEVDGQPVIARFYFGTINLTPATCRVRVRTPSGEALLVKAFEENGVYDNQGTYLGSLAYLAGEALNLDWLKNMFFSDAVAHPQREELKVFSCGVELTALDYCLREDQTGALHHIEELQISGQVTFVQAEVPLTITDLAGRRYGAGMATIHGRPTVWVGTTDETAETTTVSWRTVDQRPLLDPLPDRPLVFPGLLMLKSRRQGVVDGPA